MSRIYRGWPNWFVQLLGGWGLLPATTRRYTVSRVLLTRRAAELERHYVADEPQRRLRIYAFTKRALGARLDGFLQRRARDDRDAGRRLN